ncbi:uncharacterized protein LOC118267611 isoform X1 [Spodoptera frugiperda]|uniref:SFRICE_004278 n=1 Tax=Spodoptera frugiperda TaxID=7108 RepID=A0A2H1VM21_SPOFR|nr:uncharacterized protein LOC118267611 isoform X1 [Spodoptera frugiperda]
MLRLLYLLSLVICIELSFCYNYLDDAAERHGHRVGRYARRDRVRRAKRPKERKSLIRHEYDYDRSPVEFDVASFIQPDDELVEEDGIPMRQRSNKRRTSKNYEYGSLMGLNVDDKKRERSSDYMNMNDAPPELNFNPQLFKDTNSLSLNQKQLNYNGLDDLRGEKFGHEKFRNIYKDELLMDQNIVHSHEKKCTLKNIKFPFFSHNKSEPLKPKKNKKRKLFCFNCPKKGSKYPDETKMGDEIKMGDDVFGHYKIKRSFEDRLCPVCKKKFMVSLQQNERRKKASRRMLHNSRQYYQNISPVAKSKENKKMFRRHNVGYTHGTPDTTRSKREDARDRQLKELEEVQRKIDNVEINIPNFEKPAEKSPYK